MAHPEVAHRPKHAEPLESLRYLCPRPTHERCAEKICERGGGRDGLACRRGEDEGACGEPRREVVVYDQRPRHLSLTLVAVLARVAENRRARPTALVRNDDEAGARRERRDARALGGGVHVAAFRDEVGVDERGGEAERGECRAEDEARAEPVGVFVGQEQGRLVGGGTGGELECP